MGVAVFIIGSLEKTRISIVRLKPASPSLITDPDMSLKRQESQL